MVSRAEFRTRQQVLVAFIGIVALEAAFYALRRLTNLELYVVETIAIALAAGVVYFVVLFSLEHTHEHRATLWLILVGAVIFRLTLVPLTPTLSNDVYRYRWDGRIQRAGWNPYSVRPDDPRLRALRDPREPAGPGHDIPSIYPPLSELMFRAADRFLPTPVAFKLPMIVADLLVVCLLAGWLRATGGRVFRLAIYAWNPLVVVEFAGSGHSDALALAALVAACLVIIRGKKTVSTMLLAAAALLKAFPVMLFPLWLRREGWPRSAKSWRDGLAAAALAAVCFWPYRSAFLHFSETMSYYASRWQGNNASLFAVLRWLSGSAKFAEGFGVAVAAGLALWVAVRRLEPARAALLIFGAVLLFSPNAYPWYFTWVIPFLCFVPNPAWTMLTILQFLSYHVLIGYQAFGTWQFRPLMLWLTYGPFYGLLLWQWVRSRRQQTGTL
jgi:alpha-1,6-mannosyltransferase